MTPLHLDRARAKHAAQEIAAAGSSDLSQSAKPLPAQIRIVGLGQAVAFLGAKDPDSAERKLCNALARWLLIKWPTLLGCRSHHAQIAEIVLAKCLVDELINLDVPSYARLTQEALAYTEWVKRLAAVAAGSQTKGPNDDHSPA